MAKARTLRCVIGAAALVVLAIAPVATPAPASLVYRIDHVVDGDRLQFCERDDDRDDPERPPSP